MLKSNVVKLSTVALIASFLVITSCKDEVPDRITLQDSADLTDEAIAEAFFADLDDMAGLAIHAPSETEFSGGRIASTVSIDDPRFKCEGITVTIVPDDNSTPQLPKGVLTIDFGTSGCTDLKGNVRKGKLIFTYNGKRFMPGSTIITTTENYSINGINLEGIRTLTNLQNSTEDAPRFNAMLVNGKATFDNGLFATRESDITWEWIREANPVNDFLRIEDASHATGVTRGGRAYEVSVLEPLIYKRSCGIAVSGVKKYIIDGEKEITIDYGDGTCDQAFTITVNGVSREISI